MPQLWVRFSRKPDVRWTSMCRMFTRECPWDKHLWKGEERKQQWAVGEVKLWCSPIIAMSNPTGISSAMAALQSRPPYGWILPGLYTPKSVLIASAPPWEGMWPWVRQLCVAEVISEVTDNWRLPADYSQQLGQQALHWRGIWVAHHLVHHA